MGVDRRTDGCFLSREGVAGNLRTSQPACGQQGVRSGGRARQRQPFTELASGAVPTSTSPHGLGPEGQAPSRQGTHRGAGRGTGLLRDRRTEGWMRREAEGEGAASETRGPSSHRAVGVGGHCVQQTMQSPDGVGDGDGLRCPAPCPRCPSRWTSSADLPPGQDRPQSREPESAAWSPSEGQPVSSAWN